VKRSIPPRTRLERLQRALDALFRDLRRVILREHAFSILFCASSAAAARVMTATWSLDSFADRPIGQATLFNSSVAARTSTYVQACIVFVVAAVLAAVVLPRVTRWLGAGVGRALEATSACGILLILMSVWRVDVQGTFVLLIAAQVLVVAPALFDRVLARVRKSDDVDPTVSDVGAYAAWLGGTAFALIEPIIDAGQDIPRGRAAIPVLIVALGLGLDLVRRLWCALPANVHRGRAASSDRFVHALAPLAALAAARVVRNELYLLASGAGHIRVRPEHVEIAFCLVVGAWCIVRARRGPRGAQVQADGRLDLERLVGRLTFPWLLCGVVALARFAQLHRNSPDFLEPANGALMIQQWFDFGRLPFFETFGAHGLSDSFFGFLFAGLTGFRESTWVEYDYVWFVLTVLITYHVLRAWWSSASAALFCALTMPRLDDFLPTFFVQSALTIFVVRWVMQKRSGLAWAAFAGWIVVVFAWRLDLGFANAVAALATIAALVVLLPEYRPPFGAIASGWIGFAAAFVLICLGVCIARGIDAVALFQDFRAMIGSNQAFGYPTIAADRTPIVVMHVFVVPVLVMVTCIASWVRLRGRIKSRDATFFAALGTAFMGAYYFANYPRGLVRHSFLEAPNIVLSSFAFFVLAGAWRWLLPDRLRLPAFFLFFVTGTMLCYDLDVNAQQTRKPLAPTTTYERLAYALRTSPRVAYEPRRVTRTLDQPWFEEMIGDIRSFFATELEQPHETFLDLSSSPMLYFHTHRRSPHWVNHTLLVYGEELQKRFIKGLEHDDLPFVVLPPEIPVDPPQVMPPLEMLDSVPFILRQYRIFEWVYARYDPLCMLGKWQVWVRKDHLLAQSPLLHATDADSAWKVLSLADARAHAATTAREPVTLRVSSEPALHVAGPIVLARDDAFALRIVGTAEQGAQLDIEIGIGGERETAPVRRTCSLPTGHVERWFWIPRSQLARRLNALTLQAHGAFDVEALELWAFGKPDALRRLDADLAAGRTTDMKQLAWLWGSHDAASASAPKILRTLDGTEVDGSRAAILPESGGEAWPHGIARDGSGFRRSASDSQRSVAVGDRLVFCSSGVRTVTAVEGPIVRVDGPPLDPQRDGNPRLVRFVSADAQAGTLVKPRHPRDYPFLPIEADERARGTYLKLRLRATTDEGARMVVVYGAGEWSWGKFVFDMQPDALAHDYAVRISAQANWTLHDCDWVRLIPSQGAVEVEGAWITAGD
jgi:hypothetical protein